MKGKDVSSEEENTFVENAENHEVKEDGAIVENVMEKLSQLTNNSTSQQNTLVLKKNVLNQTWMELHPS